MKDKNHSVICSKNIIESIDNIEALGLYLYLLALPEDLPIFKSVIKDHFKIGWVKLNKLFSYLCKKNLLIYEQKKLENGRFARPVITVKKGI